MRLVTDRPTVDSCPLGSDGREDPRGPPRPTPRGPLSAAVLLALRQPPGCLGPTPPVAVVDALADDDLQLALYLCYELHYRGLAGADADWEWDPALLGFRAELERAFLQRLHDEISPVRRVQLGDVRGALSEMIAGESGPSLSTFVLESGTLVQLQEFCMHRSAYQLKEAGSPHLCHPETVRWRQGSHGGDPARRVRQWAGRRHALGPLWQHHDSVGPRSHLRGVSRSAARGDIGHGQPGIDVRTAPTLAGALVGHLAVFEMTSVGPMERYSRALARLGIGAEGRRFYDVHVEADVRHGAIALERMVAGLAEVEPYLGADLLFGAAAVLLVEQRFSCHLLNSWSSGRSSLISPGTDLTERTPPQQRATPRLASTRSPSILALRGLRTRTV